MPSLWWLLHSYSLCFCLCFLQECPGTTQWELFKGNYDSLPFLGQLLFPASLSLLSALFPSSPSPTLPPPLLPPRPYPPSRPLLLFISFFFFFCHVQHLYSGSLAQAFSGPLLDLHQLSAQREGLFIISPSRLFLGGELIAFLALISSKQTHKKKQTNQSQLWGLLSPCLEDSSTGNKPDITSVQLG